MADQKYERELLFYLHLPNLAAIVDLQKSGVKCISSKSLGNQPKIYCYKINFKNSNQIKSKIKKKKDGEW